MQLVTVLERREEQGCLADFKMAICLLVLQALLSRISQPGGAELVDTRPLVLPVSRTGVKFPDAFATMCSRIAAALKAGRPVVLDLQDLSPHW